MREPDLDRRLVGWMRDGPHGAPPDVVNRALIETTTVVQMPREEDESVLPGILLGTLLAAVVFVLLIIVLVVWLID
jgi:hypothetical protein